MKINPGYIVSKVLKYINRPALRDCSIDKTSRIGSGSNCIAVTMGKYSYMGKNNSVTNTQIGNYCSIASYCAIGGDSHDLFGVSTSPIIQGGRNVFGISVGNKEPISNRKVIIGNDVWIGESVFVKNGINIGTGAVIGAHSVVTHDVPDYAIVAGVPARVIRYRFDDNTIAKLKKTEWWNLEISKLKSLAIYLNDTDEFCQKVLQENNP